MARGRLLAEAGQAADASATLGEALGLRRGEPLADFAYAGLFDAERARLDELALVAIETWAGADLVLGRHGELAAGLEACAGRTRCASACGSCASWPCTGPGARPRPCAPTPKSATAWSASSASTLARPCATSNPHPDPAPLAQSRTSAARAPPPDLRRAPPCQPPCSRRSSTSRGRGGIWCRVRAWPSGSIAGQRRSSRWYPRPPASARRRCSPSGSRRDRPRRPTGGRLAWLSLDRGDNDLASFWAYVIAALRTAAPGVGEDALALLAGAPRRRRSKRCLPRCSTT